MASTEACLPAGSLVCVSAQHDQANQGAQMTGPAASRLVVFGIDPHKATHTVVAVDEVGRQVDQRTVAARTPSIWSCSAGPARPQGMGNGSGRSRTVATCLVAWSGTCWLLASGSCGAAQVDGRHPDLGPGSR